MKQRLFNLFPVFLLSLLSCKDKASLKVSAITRTPGLDTSINIYLQPDSLENHHYEFVGLLIKKIIRPVRPLVISKKLVFRKCIFIDSADFSNIRFEAPVDFTGSEFHAITCFSIDTFRKKAIFFRTRFDNIVNFSSSVFDSTIDFSTALFHRTLRFDGLTLGDHAKFNFTGAAIPFPQGENLNTLDFSFTSSIPGRIDLTAAKFGEKPTIIQFYKSDIAKFDLDYQHFKIILNERIINPFKKNAFFGDSCSQCSGNTAKIPDSLWDKLSTDDNSAIYESLLNNFRIGGKEESIKLLDVEYHLYQWENKPLYISWLVMFPYCWDDFGYKKGMIFVWTVYVFLIFWIINYRFLNYLNQDIYTMDNIPNEMSEKRGWYSFIYTAFLFFGLTLHIEKINIKNKIGSFYIIFVYAIGLVCLAYMANYILQKG